MFRTRTDAETGTSTAPDWRQFDDRDAHRDQIATDLRGALTDPGY